VCFGGFLPLRTLCDAYDEEFESHKRSILDISKIAKFKKAVAGFDQNFKVASHVDHFNHNMNFENVKVVGFRSLALYFGPERWEQSYRTSRSLQRHRANMNYIVHARKLRVTLL